MFGWALGNANSEAPTTIQQWRQRSHRYEAVEAVDNTRDEHKWQMQRWYEGDRRYTKRDKPTSRTCGVVPQFWTTWHHNTPSSEKSICPKLCATLLHTFSRVWLSQKFANDVSALLGREILRTNFEPNCTSHETMGGRKFDKLLCWTTGASDVLWLWN